MVLLLGVTLGPVSLAIAYNLYVNFVGSPPLYDVKEGPVFVISALAFLVAELLTGRGKRSASLGR